MLTSYYFYLDYNLYISYFIFFQEFYKSGINCKPVLVSVCKLETRMRRLLDIVNQSEEVLDIEDLPPEVRQTNCTIYSRDI